MAQGLWSLIFWEYSWPNRDLRYVEQIIILPHQISSWYSGGFSISCGASFYHCYSTSGSVAVLKRVCVERENVPPFFETERTTFFPSREYMFYAYNICTLSTVTLKGDTSSNIDSLGRQLLRNIEKPLYAVSNDTTNRFSLGSPNLLIYHIYQSSYDTPRVSVSFPIPHRYSHTCLVDVTNHTDWNQTKGLYIPRNVSRYSVYNSTVFNGVYTKQGKVD